uniref:helix-turn-helix domain-containing protein n=1 Tax=Azospirillum argentinense TaxID=2970906 RepID=UPI001FFF452A|nr:AraC family transcriptional regulator [Azospirillum argentinense]
MATLAGAEGKAKGLELLVAFLTIGHERPATGLSRAERDRLHHARNRLLDDLANPPTIAELARACGLNALKLKRGFKALSGLPVHAFYQQERMRAARRMLVEEGLSVTETGSRLG